MPVLQQLEIGEAVFIEWYTCPARRREATEDVLPFTMQALGMDFVALAL